MQYRYIGRVRCCSQGKVGNKLDSIIPIPNLMISYCPRAIQHLTIGKYEIGMVVWWYLEEVTLPVRHTPICPPHKFEGKVGIQSVSRRESWTDRGVSRGVI